MAENCYFEGSETFYANVEFESSEEDDIMDASWISQR